MSIITKIKYKHKDDWVTKKHSATDIRYVNNLHNEDGPAVISINTKTNIKTVKEWRINGKLHRIDKPAVIHYDEETGNTTSEMYWQNNLLHNEKGPAVIFYGQDKKILFVEYWLDGKIYNSQEEFENVLFKKKLAII